MKKTKKIIALLLSMILALSFLSMVGCGSKTTKDNDNESSDVTTGAQQITEAAESTEDELLADIIPKETVTLDVYSQTANYSGEQIGWFAKVILDKFNVKLNIIKNEDGVFTTRMESGDLGDIVIFGSDASDYITAANTGMLFDWNEDDLLTDYGPYMKEHMDKALEKNAALTDSNIIYGFGNDVAGSSEDHTSFGYHPDIRWDLYKQLGYPKVGTLDDLVGVLGDMKKICPTSDSGKETYGVSMFTDWDGDMVMYVKSTAGLYGYEEFGLGLYDVNTQTWQGSLDDGGMYLKCLKFYNDLYQNDLVDPDSMTQGSEGANEDYIDGAAFWTIFNFLGSSAYNTQTHLDAGKAMYTLAMDDQNTLVYGLNVFGGSRVCTIGASTQYPELCMAILNWLATPEGCMTTNYGPQDLCWYYDENGKTQLTELGLACRNDTQTEMTGDGFSGQWKDGTNQMAVSTWNLDSANPDSNGESYNYQSWASYQSTLTSDILNDWRSFTGFTTQDEYLGARDFSVVIGTSFSMAARSDELDVIWQQVTTTIKDYSWKAIYAETDDEFNSIVKEMQNKANEYGYAECCEFVQEQAALRKAAEDQAK